MDHLQQHLIETEARLPLNKQVEQLFDQQISEWPLLQSNIEALKSIERRHISFNDFGFEVQHNPARERSTCADTRKTAIEIRPCFLCINNLPPQQKGILLLDRYLLLANPYPIFENHLTISDIEHTPQNIGKRLGDMLQITRQLESYTVFYNGPACGASAPDHFHFQACPFGAMPIDNELITLGQSFVKETFKNEKIVISKIDNYLRTVFVFESDDSKEIIAQAEKLIETLPFHAESGEPMFNLMCNYQKEKYRLLLFPRIAQRPQCFYKTGSEQLVVSVASVELGGIIVTPRHVDYLKITKDDLVKIFEEVTLKYT